MQWTIPFLLLMIMGTALPDLDSLRDRNRVLLLFAASSTEPALAEQQKLLRAQEQELNERDLRVFEVLGNGEPERHMRKQFGVAESEPFSLVLVGKDGTRKLRKSHPVSTEDLFRLIDSMPMRRHEMRQSH